MGLDMREPASAPSPIEKAFGLMRLVAIWALPAWMLLAA
jgi:hypothetical protein